MGTSVQIGVQVTFSRNLSCSGRFFCRLYRCCRRAESFFRFRTLVVWINMIRRIAIFILSVIVNCLILRNCSPVFRFVFRRNRFDRFVPLQGVMRNRAFALRIGFNSHNDRLDDHRRPLRFFRPWFCRRRSGCRFCFFSTS